MNSAAFSLLAQTQFVHCMHVLGVKDSEYSSDDDRLHNFKAAALLENTTPRKALMGMMAKHTISIYDMCQSEQPYTDECWEEKLTDSINYLVLLKAVLQDEKSQGAGDQLPLFTENGIDTKTLLTDLEIREMTREEYTAYCRRLQEAGNIIQRKFNERDE